MNKTYSPYLRHLLVMVLMSGWISMIQAQGIVSVAPNTGQAGTTLNMIITGSNTLLAPASWAYLQGNGWYITSTSHTYTSNTTMSATFNIPTLAPPGPYNVGYEGWGFNFGLPNGFNMSSPQTGAFLSGKLILDSNQNCIQDQGDIPLANKIIEVQPGPYYGATDANGEFGLWVPLGTYTVSTNITVGQAFQCPAAGSYTVSPNVNMDTINNLEFYLYETGSSTFNNLKVISLTSPHRPGFSAYTQFKVYNTGNQPMSGYTLTGTVDGSMLHLSEAPAASSVSSTSTSHTMTWNIPTMAPGDVLVFTSYDSLPASIPLGTWLPRAATITPGDDNVADNTTSGIQIVTGSYDPNDKQVWNESSVNADGFIEPEDSVLQYLIRCQNTGTDTAFNIYIRDTLDVNLDPATLEIIDASHNYQISVDGPGYVEFSFPNILLVDSATNEPGSNAHIEYTIKRRPGLPLGTQLDNTAHIYFDFNDPIVTNTVSSIICPGLASGFGVSVNGLTVAFSDSASGTIGTYLWTFGDGNTSASPNPTHTYAAPGNYTVCQYVSNSCGRIDSTCSQVSFGVGLGESFFSAFDLYPNPTSNEVVLDLELLKGGDLEVRISDALGRTVQEGSVRVGAGKLQQKIDLGAQAAGIYFLRLEMNGQSVTRKILRE